MRSVSVPSTQAIGSDDSSATWFWRSHASSSEAVARLCAESPDPSATVGWMSALCSNAAQPRCLVQSSGFHGGIRSPSGSARRRRYPTSSTCCERCLEGAAKHHRRAVWNREPRGRRGRRPASRRRNEQKRSEQSAVLECGIAKVFGVAAPAVAIDRECRKRSGCTRDVLALPARGGPAPVIAGVVDDEVAVDARDAACSHGPGQSFEAGTRQARITSGDQDEVTPQCAVVRGAAPRGPGCGSDSSARVRQARAGGEELVRRRRRHRRIRVCVDDPADPVDVDDRRATLPHGHGQVRARRRVQLLDSALGPSSLVASVAECSPATQSPVARHVTPRRQSVRDGSLCVQRGDCRRFRVQSGIPIHVAGTDAGG